MMAAKSEPKIQLTQDASSLRAVIATMEEEPKASARSDNNGSEPIFHLKRAHVDEPNTSTEFFDQDLGTIDNYTSRSGSITLPKSSNNLHNSQVNFDEEALSGDRNPFENYAHKTPGLRNEDFHPTFSAMKGHLASGDSPRHIAHSNETEPALKSQNFSVSSHKEMTNASQPVLFDDQRTEERLNQDGAFKLKSSTESRRKSGRDFDSPNPSVGWLASAMSSGGDRPSANHWPKSSLQPGVSTLGSSHRRVLYDGFVNDDDWNRSNSPNGQENYAKQFSTPEYPLHIDKLAPMAHHYEEPMASRGGYIRDTHSQVTQSPNPQFPPLHPSSFHAIEGWGSDPPQQTKVDYSVPLTHYSTPRPVEGFSPSRMRVPAQADAATSELMNGGIMLDRPTAFPRRVLHRTIDSPASVRPTMLMNAGKDSVLKKIHSYSFLPKLDHYQKYISDYISKESMRQSSIEDSFYGTKFPASRFRNRKFSSKNENDYSVKNQERMPMGSRQKVRQKFMIPNSSLISSTQTIDLEPFKSMQFLTPNLVTSGMRQFVSLPNNIPVIPMTVQPPMFTPRPNNRRTMVKNDVSSGTHSGYSFDRYPEDRFPTDQLKRRFRPVDSHPEIDGNYYSTSQEPRASGLTSSMLNGVINDFAAPSDHQLPHEINFFQEAPYQKKTLKKHHHNKTRLFEYKEYPGNPQVEYSHRSYQPNPFLAQQYESLSSNADSHSAIEPTSRVNQRFRSQPNLYNIIQEQLTNNFDPTLGLPNDHKFPTPENYASDQGQQQALTQLTFVNLPEMYNEIPGRQSSSFLAPTDTSLDSRREQNMVNYLPFDQQNTFLDRFPATKRETTMNPPQHQSHSPNAMYLAMQNQAQLMAPSRLDHHFMGGETTDGMREMASNLNSVNSAKDANLLSQTSPDYQTLREKQSLSSHNGALNAIDNSEPEDASKMTPTKGKKRSSDLFANAGQILLSALPLLLAPTLGLMFAASPRQSVIGPQTARFQHSGQAIPETSSHDMLNKSSQLGNVSDPLDASQDLSTNLTDSSLVFINLTGQERLKKPAPQVGQTQGLEHTLTPEPQDQFEHSERGNVAPTVGGQKQTEKSKTSFTLTALTGISLHPPKGKLLTKNVTVPTSRSPSGPTRTTVQRVNSTYENFDISSVTAPFSTVQTQKKVALDERKESNHYDHQKDFIIDSQEFLGIHNKTTTGRRQGDHNDDTISITLKENASIPTSTMPHYDIGYEGADFDAQFASLNKTQQISAQQTHTKDDSARPTTSSTPAPFTKQFSSDNQSEDQSFHGLPLFPVRRRKVSLVTSQGNRTIYDSPFRFHSETIGVNEHNATGSVRLDHLGSVNNPPILPTRLAYKYDNVLSHQDDVTSSTKADSRLANILVSTSKSAANPVLRFRDSMDIIENEHLSGIPRSVRQGRRFKRQTNDSSIQETFSEGNNESSWRDRQKRLVKEKKIVSKLYNSRKSSGRLGIQKPNQEHLRRNQTNQNLKPVRLEDNLKRASTRTKTAIVTTMITQIGNDSDDDAKRPSPSDSPNISNSLKPIGPIRGERFREDQNHRKLLGFDGHISPDKHRQSFSLPEDTEPSDILRRDIIEGIHKPIVANHGKFILQPVQSSSELAEGEVRKEDSAMDNLSHSKPPRSNRHTAVDLLRDNFYSSTENYPSFSNDFTNQIDGNSESDARREPTHAQYLGRMHFNNQFDHTGTPISYQRPSRQPNRMIYRQTNQPLDSNGIESRVNGPPDHGFMNYKERDRQDRPFEKLGKFTLKNFDKHFEGNLFQPDTFRGRIHGTDRQQQPDYHIPNSMRYSDRYDYQMEPISPSRNDGESSHQNSNHAIHGDYFHRGTYNDLHSRSSNLRNDTELSYKDPIRGLDLERPSGSNSGLDSPKEQRFSNAGPPGYQNHANYSGSSNQQNLMTNVSPDSSQYRGDSPNYVNNLGWQEGTVNSAHSMNDYLLNRNQVSDSDRDKLMAR